APRLPEARRAPAAEPASPPPSDGGPGCRSPAPHLSRPPARLVFPVPESDAAPPPGAPRASLQSPRGRGRLALVCERIPMRDIDCTLDRATVRLLRELASGYFHGDE